MDVKNNLMKQELLTYIERIEAKTERMEKWKIGNLRTRRVLISLYKDTILDLEGIIHLNTKTIDQYATELKFKIRTIERSCVKFPHTDQQIHALEVIVKELKEIGAFHA